MTGDELADSTVTSLLEAYRDGSLSPVEVTRACIDRIHETDPDVGAVITLLSDEAVLEAEESQRRYANGTARVLEGVPYGLKDIIATAGIRTTGASRFYREFVPVYSASVYERLHDAGGVLVAKLNTFPFALGSEHGDAFGPVRNPWDLARTPGGSSAGSAAALACGQLPLAVGTDTGGSIRLPSTWCGVSGLKATNGRVPVTGVMPLAWSLDTVGPMARSAEDLALALGVMAGPDGADRAALPAAVPDYVTELAKGVSGLRVAMPRPWFLERCDPDVVAATEQAADALRSMGAVISDVTFPHASQSMVVGWTILLAELGSLHTCHADQLDRFDPTFAEYVRQSGFVSAHDYLACLRSRADIQQDFRTAMAEIDAVLVPGNVAAAPKLDDMLLDIGDESVHWLELAARHTFVFNITGMPSVVVPGGLNRFGLPIGVQIAAAPFREDICLRLAHAFQQVTEHHRLKPPPFASAT